MWKPIDGYEGYYEVSDLGEVRSLDRVVVNSRGGNKSKARLIHGRVMKLSRSQNGYLVVNLHKDGISNVICIHTLVAKAFVPNIHNNPTVNHIDGNKYNNRATNLEWVSYAENNTHALRSGLRMAKRNPVLQYTLKHKLINEYSSVTEASRQTGISRGMISHCVNGRLKQAGGYIWTKLSESSTTIPNGSTQGDELPAEAQRLRLGAEDIVYAISNNGVT